jgi:hypothetical protein
MPLLTGHQRPRNEQRNLDRLMLVLIIGLAAFFVWIHMASR